MNEHRKIKYTKKVLSTALIELLHQKSLPNISITELCEKADINRSTFYSHYKDIMDLYYEIEGNLIDYMNQMLDRLVFSQPNQSTLNMITRMLDFLKEHPADVEVLLGDDNTALFQNKIITSIYERAGILEPNLQSEEAMKYMYVIHGSIALIKAWIKERFKTSTTELSRSMYQLGTAVLKK